MDAQPSQELRHLIQKVSGGATLSEVEIRTALEQMTEGAATPAQMGAFLMALRVRGETVEEITGAAQMMRARMKRVEVAPGAVDIVVIDSVAKANPDVTRLTLHCNMGGKDLKVCASTSADKKGKASDPEDKKAIDTNQTVVLEEGSALDVTVPLHVKDGKPMSACGVTLKTAGMTRDQAVAKATQIAKAVEAGLPECCTDCCK